MKHKGLLSEEVNKKQLQYGKNALPDEKGDASIKIFFAQFTNPLVYILAFAGLISLFLGKYLDIALIFSVVLINAAMGFFQEHKTQKTLLALQKLVKPHARVLRDGKRQEIEVSELVPDDVVFLTSGERIPADGRVIEARSFFVSEAILTGESEALEKSEDGEVYMGTIVSSGRAVVRVENIGLKTKIGAIAETLRDTTQPVTTLQLRLKKLTNAIIYISIALSGMIFALGFLAGRDIWQMAELSAILLVAIIPEALLIVITLVLVLAMRDSLKRKALIRKILAVETLGSVTTICTDKTGTLTEGRMKVAESNLADERRSLLAMCLCNDRSDTVEIALWEYLNELKDFEPQAVFDKHARLSELPFNSDRKFMATVNTAFRGDDLVLVKGAPEVVLAMSKVSESEQRKIMAEVDRWAASGLKVLAFASRNMPLGEAEALSAGYISDLEWSGIVGLWDPPRKDVKEALAVARESGVKVKVVTGDYHRTAEKIMQNLGMEIGPGDVLEGAEMEKLNDGELKSRIPSTLLFARVTPQQKLRIVSILQELGEVVAMTGDGVNDAPALKKSNIGIVVGDASEVAKETADLILLDNNFKTIVSAIEAGRLVFENIKKIILFILSNSFAEIVVILGALMLDWPLPLTVVQILWLHILCDGPEDFVLGFEPKEKETMLDGPKKMDEPILGRFSILLIFVTSSLSGLLSLVFFWYFGMRQGNLELGRTMAFMSLAFSSVIYIFSCRTLRKPFWRYENFWSNKWLFSVVAFSLFLALSMTYFPPTQKLLDLVPLQAFHWALLLAKALVLVLVIEIIKTRIRSGGSDSSKPACCLDRD